MEIPPYNDDTEKVFNALSHHIDYIDVVFYPDMIMIHGAVLRQPFIGLRKGTKIDSAEIKDNVVVLWPTVATGIDFVKFRFDSETGQADVVDRQFFPRPGTKLVMPST